MFISGFLGKFRVLAIWFFDFIRGSNEITLTILSLFILTPILFGFQTGVIKYARKKVDGLN
jgi:hypothetical protein